MNEKPGINPYQPPTISDDSTPPLIASFDTINLELDDKTPIPFSGSADEGDLGQFLKSYDSLGTLPITIGVVFACMLQFWAVMISGIFAVVVASGILMAIIAVLASSRWYRSIVFTSNYPTWRDHSEGELTAEGIHLRRETETSFYRWSWFSGVVVCDGMVGFVPAEDSEMPTLISAQMLPSSVPFVRLAAFARSAKVVCEGEFESGGISWANRQVMREPKRERSVVPPSNAVLFQGPVTGLDLKDLSQQIASGKPTIRARAIRLVLMLGVAICVLGLVSLLSRAPNMRGIILISVLGGSLLLLINLKTRRRAAMMTVDNFLYFLIGHANDEGLTTDFFVAVTTIPWSNIAIQFESSNRLLLRQKSSRKVLIVRRDMCESEADWQRLLGIVRKAGAGDGFEAPSSRS